MRISEIRLHPIAIADAPLRSSYGRHAPYALRTIVEIKTTDGITGVSETYGGDGPLAALEAVKPRILGMDPFRLMGLWRELVSDAKTASGDRSQTYLVPGENPLDQHTRTFAAIEVALPGHYRQGSRKAGLRSGRRPRARPGSLLRLSLL